jgi:hypothetical protein
VKEGHLKVYAKLSYIDSTKLTCLGGNDETL